MAARSRIEGIGPHLRSAFSAEEKITMSFDMYRYDKGAVLIGPEREEENPFYFQ